MTVPVLRTIDLRGQDLSQAQLGAVLPRQGSQYRRSAEQKVQQIIDRVGREGAPYVKELAAQFDGVQQEKLRVAPERLAAAAKNLDPLLKESLEISISRARAFARVQRPQDAALELAPGARLTHRWVPVDRAGIYVPGGLAVYPSSVVMNVVPAQAAGVESILLCSPPQKEFSGEPHPTILAAAHLLGVSQVWAIGGAQAIAAMALGLLDGAEELVAVDTVTGPGNIYVALAKRALQGKIGIDSEAGPTEIAVIADAQANPSYVAADLISQAEHDPQAAAVLITDSPELAGQVQSCLREQIGATKHAQRITTSLQGQQSALILTDDEQQSVAVANAYAAEHLEVQTRHPDRLAAKIRHAGAIFLGPYSPVALGDYAASSNHVLPTGGTAAFASGLSTASFMKAVQVIDYSASALAQLAEPIVALAQSEDLPAHGQAVSLRMGGQ